MSFLSGKKHSKNNIRQKNRRLSFECLENRELLSVSETEIPEPEFSEEDFALIRKTYPDLNLSENSEDYNIIEITDATQDALQGALDMAIETNQSDLIVVRTTLDHNTVTLKKQSLILRYDIEETGIRPENETVTIVSLGEKELVIDCDEKAGGFISYAGNLCLGGITIINGNASSLRGGGGIYIASGDLVVTKCTITNNYPGRQGIGAGIRCGGDITLTDSIVSGNQGEGIYAHNNVTIINSDISSNQGDGIYVGYYDFYHFNIDIRDSTISNNEGFGVKVYDSHSGWTSSNPKNVSISSCVISENNNTGISVDADRLTIIDSLISGNNKEDLNYNGGGIESQASTVIINCVITENKAREGGGIYQYVFTSGERLITIINSTISNNMAQHGGGLYIMDWHWNYGIVPLNHASSLIINSTISGNSAAIYSTRGRGGGIYYRSVNSDKYFHDYSDDNNHDDFRRLQLINTTVTGNMAGISGGGIFVEHGYVNLRNSILAENFNNHAPQFEITRIKTSYSLIDDTAGLLEHIVETGPNLLGTEEAPVSPKFQNAVKLENGHIYYPLSDDSPCIDAGNDGYFDTTMEFPTDISGNPRIFGERIDIGASEHVTPCPAPVFEFRSPRELQAGEGAVWIFETTNNGGVATTDWLISWGDATQTHIPGGPRDQVAPRHHYEKPGEYVIQVTTTDYHNRKFVFEVPVSVQNSSFIPDEDPGEDPVIIPRQTHRTASAFTEAVWETSPEQFFETNIPETLLNSVLHTEVDLISDSEMLPYEPTEIETPWLWHHDFGHRDRDEKLFAS